MKRLLLALAFLLALVPAPALAAGCTFTGAFRELHDAIPAIVGDCRGNEYPTTAVSLGISPTQAASEGLDYFYDPASTSWKMYNSNRAQDTSKGLLVYGPNTSIRAEFTNGYQTWGFDYPADHWPDKGPNGTAVRLNTQHFPWEVTQPAPPPSASASTSPAVVRPLVTPNWSGYLLTGGPFTEIHGEWTVPVSIPSRAQAIWPGIGGWGNDSTPLLQAGTETVDGNLLTDVLEFFGGFGQRPWIEDYPGPTSYVGPNAREGDYMSVDIKQVSGATWTVSMTLSKDGFAKWSQTYTDNYGPNSSSAEWIFEDYGDAGPSCWNATQNQWIVGCGGEAPLALTQTVHFSNCWAKTADGRILTPRDARMVVMAGSSGAFEAWPGAALPMADAPGAYFNVVPAHQAY